MTDTATPARPLSPHFQVYRWPITMVMSIAHRVTGGALFFGTLLLVYLLDGPVHRLSRAGVRRPLAILIVYITALTAFVVFMAITSG